MEYILDANTIIYLVKLNLHEDFINLLQKDNFILDSSVYDEVITKGIKNNYPDAYVAKKFLQENQIPVIPTDISKEIHKFRDPGETSCAILALNSKTRRVCISSDKKALKKFAIHGIPAVQLDTIYYNLLVKLIITEDCFFSILYKLEKIYAIDSDRIFFFSNLIQSSKSESI